MQGYQLIEPGAGVSDARANQGRKITHDSHSDHCQKTRNNWIQLPSLRLSPPSAAIMIGNIILDIIPYDTTFIIPVSQPHAFATVSGTYHDTD